ncbi:MAG TPA: dihydrolipoyl dehydrogenase [Chloroflexota bacterium]
MNGERFDLLVLGGGPGGYPAAIRAAQLGLKVALVEKYKVGGTCLHWGCIPTKVILESAEILQHAKEAKEFGVVVSEPSLDYNAVMQRRERVVSQHHRGTQGLLKSNGVTTFIGEGRLTSPTSVSVKLEEGGETKEISATDVIVATGSMPKSLPGITIDGDRVINSDHAVTLPELPKSVIIIGAGAIGVEFASGWREMGVEVTVVEVLPRLVPLEDREIGEELGKQLGRRGIKLLIGAKVMLDSVKSLGDHVEVDVESGGNRQTLSAERLLVATGRAAVTAGIGLEEIGVQMERGFIKVDGQMRTNVQHLYAIGDCVGGLMLAHKATHEGFVAVETILDRDPHPLDQNRVPRCTYCRPQIASLGLGEDEAKEKGYSVKVGKFPFTANGMATILGERVGFAKIVSDAETMEILGVHLIGPRVTELISGQALAKLLESTPEEIALNVHPHPTLSEALGEAAEDVFGQAIHFYKPKQPVS